MAVVLLCSAMRGWVPQGCHRLPRPTPFLGDLVLTQACLQPGSLLNPNVLHMHSPLIPSDVIVAPQISSCRDLSSPTPKSGSLLLPCALSCLKPPVASHGTGTKPKPLAFAHALLPILQPYLRLLSLHSIHSHRDSSLVLNHQKRFHI